MSYDKKLHFIAGFVLCLGFGVFSDIYTGIGAAVVAGIMKECYDQYTYDGADWKDMLATWCGGCVAFTLLSLIAYWR